MTVAQANGGNPAKITFSVAGTKTEDGKSDATFNVFGKNYSVRIEEDDTDATIATKLAKAMNADKLSDETAGEFNAEATNDGGITLTAATTKI